ncbi:MAG: VOC family protein [Pseudomonadota bacterium]
MTEARPWKPPATPDLVSFIIVKDPQATLDFARKVLGAEARKPPLLRGDGSIWNMEIACGEGVIIVSGDDGGFEVPGFIYAFVPNSDQAHAAALEAGATAIMPPTSQFYGIRDGGVRDANGTIWWFGTHVEDVPADELQERAYAEEKKRHEGAGG